MKQKAKLNNHENTHEETIDEEVYDEELFEEEEEEGKKQSGHFRIFFISTMVHLFLILLLTLLYWSYPAQKEDVIITTSPIAQEEEEEEVPEEREIVKQLVEVVSDVVSEVTPIVTTEDVVVEMETENEMEAETAEGVSEAISDMPLVGSGIMGNIGGGGGSFGTRSGGGKKRAVMKGGGNKKTESAVDAALRWLKRHQEKDGSWDSNKYGLTDKKWSENDSVTGLAVLAFLSAGHTPKIGKYRKTVKAGIDWIISRQNPDGSWGRHGNGYVIYDAAICTLTLAECYGMYAHPKIRDAAQKGIDYLLNPDQKKVHWGYENGSSKSMSVNGWIVMAIKSSKIAGLKVPKDAFVPYKKLVDILTEERDGYKGFVKYNINQKRYSLKKNETTMTAVGMLCNLYFGVHRSNLTNQADLVMRELPDWQKAVTGGKGFGGVKANDFYHWYYGTLAMFQYGGNAWKSWNKALMAALLPSQRKGGPLDGSVNDTDGSWDPETRWGASQGRVYTTAMGAFCFEVYYRYKSVTK